MTVRIYVSRDAEGRPWPPGMAHEIRAVEEIVSALWVAFHHSDSLYVLVVNPRRPSADMIVIGERGIGIMEFKEHRGKMTIDGEGQWRADCEFIKGGSYANPHAQVQGYGKELRGRLLNRILPEWLKPEQRDRLKFQTAVCFTNPLADLSVVRASAQTLNRASWEDGFSIIATQDVPDWVLALSFELDLGPQADYQPYSLDPETVISLAADTLGASEWTDLVRLMPEPKPYACLVMLDNETETQTFSLTTDELTMGREADNGLVVPTRFQRTSRHHALISRTLRDVMIRDANSKHGTYVNGKRIDKARPLKNGDKITLGGPQGSATVAAFRFRPARRAGVGPTAE
jgi:hypothetical protein